MVLYRQKIERFVIIGCYIGVESLQRREINIPGNPPSEELYRFGADGNLRLYSYDRLFYSLYGYDGGTTRTYKYTFDLNPQWSIYNMPRNA